MTCGKQREERVICQRRRPPEALASVDVAAGATADVHPTGVNRELREKDHYPRRLPLNIAEITPARCVVTHIRHHSVRFLAVKVSDAARSDRSADLMFACAHVSRAASCHARSIGPRLTNDKLSNAPAEAAVRQRADAGAPV
jgi:hypothetical protein